MMMTSFMKVISIKMDAAVKTFATIYGILEPKYVVVRQDVGSICVTCVQWRKNIVNCASCYSPECF